MRWTSETRFVASASMHEVKRSFAPSYSMYDGDAAVTASFKSPASLLVDGGGHLPFKLPATRCVRLLNAYTVPEHCAVLHDGTCEVDPFAKVLPGSCDRHRRSGR